MTVYELLLCAQSNYRLAKKQLDDALDAIKKEKGLRDPVNEDENKKEIGKVVTVRIIEWRRILKEDCVELEEG